MPNAIGICPVCLRTDRKLKVIESRLSEFHDELCDFSVDIFSPHYCLECEYLLKKLYKFKNKCIMAIKIFNNWQKTKASEKKPVKFLYKLLPASALAHWTPNTTRIYSFSHQYHGELVPNILRSETSQISALGIPNIVLVPIESIVESDHVDCNQIINLNTLHKDDIKLEIDDETDLNGLHLQQCFNYKTEETNDLNDILKNDNHSHIDQDIDSVSENDIETENFLDDTRISSDDFDTKLNPKHCNDKSKSKANDKNYSSNKISLAELAKSLDICKKNDEKITDKEGKRKRGESKKNVIDKGDTKRRKVVTKTNRDIGSNKKQRFHTKKDIIAELTCKDDSIVKDEIGEKDATKQLRRKKRKSAFSKERLKSDLIKTFSQCGELTADDGSAIDKEFIIDCLDDKLTEFVMKQLWNAVHDKTGIKTKALKLFKCIQNKYKNEYESVFDIEYLNTKEKMMEEFQKRKTYECYVNAEYKCDVCYQGFKHEKKLEYHKRCHEESAGNFVCSICNVRQKQKKSLISHVSSHEAVYKCKLCSLVTYYKCSMVNHYQLHKGVKFRCETCDVTFGSRSAYRSHVSYRHPRRHVCTLCGRAFFSHTGLKWHNTREHQDETPNTDESNSVKCEQCDLTFPTKDVYLKHVRITHEEVVRGRPPGSTSSYSTRVCGPRKKPVITCRVCNAVGSSIGWLSLHFRMEHPSVDMSLIYADKRTHLCDVCGKGFSTVYTLRAHLATHSTARPFACGVCPARFYQALSLRQHRVRHLPPSRTCHYCGKKFRSQSNLSNHVRFHIGDRRYKCKLCGKGFLHRNTLNEHVRGVHHHVRRVRKRGVTEARGLPLTEDRGD